MDPWNYLPAHRTVCAGSGRGILQPAALGHFLNARQHGSHIFKMSFSGIGIMDFITIMLALLFVDMFDTIGTVIGCAAKADMLDEKGKLPEVRSILLSDAVGTTVGAVFGTQQLPHSSNLQRVSLTAGAPGLPQSSQAFSFCCHFSCRPYFSLYHHLHSSSSHHCRIHDDAADSKRKNRHGRT